MKTKIFLALSALLLSACSIETEECTKVDQDSIYQSLSASYDAGTDRTTSSATLRFGGPTGTTLATDGNCAVSHDAYSLEMESLLGTSYVGSGSGFRATHAFTFRDNNNRAYQNSGSIVSVAFAGSPPTSISKSTGLTIHFSGATGSQDQVQVNLIPASGSSIVKVSSGSGASSINISVSDLSLASTGSATLFLRRVKHNTLTQTTGEGGDFIGSYTTVKYNVSITD